MSVNVWSQKYLFFVETNTAGCCHLRMSPAVFVKTKTQIFLTKPRDIYSHFWKGYFPDITSWILSRGLIKDMFLVATNTAGEVLISQKATAGSYQEVWTRPLDRQASSSVNSITIISFLLRNLCTAKS